MEREPRNRNLLQGQRLEGEGSMEGRPAEHQPAEQQPTKQQQAKQQPTVVFEAQRGLPLCPKHCSAPFEPFTEDDELVYSFSQSNLFQHCGSISSLLLKAAGFQGHPPIPSRRLARSRKCARA